MHDPEVCRCSSSKILASSFMSRVGHTQMYGIYIEKFHCDKGRTSLIAVTMYGSGHHVTR